MEAPLARRNRDHKWKKKNKRLGTKEGGREKSQSKGGGNEEQQSKEGGKKHLPDS